MRQQFADLETQLSDIFGRHFFFQMGDSPGVDLQQSLPGHLILFLFHGGTGLERGLLVTFNALGSVLVLGASLTLMVHHDRTMFMSRDTWDAVRFLRAHARERAVVLAPPATSLFVMAATSLRVVHGHPAETPRAAATRAAIGDFYRGATPLPDTLLARVDWIVAGARDPVIPAGFERAFASGEVEVYGRRR